MTALLVFILASCATTTTSTITETTAVTKTLLVSQQFGRFQDAVAISTDQFGNTYVVDRGGPSVIKYNDVGDSLGVISGFGRDQYQFDMPADIDARLTNSILIADHNNHRIERYTRDFAYSATVERRQEDQEQLRFGYPTQLAADDAGNFYLLDAENKRVLRVNSSMRPERILGGYAQSTNPSGVLVNPKKLAVDGNGNVIVFDQAAARLVVYDELGNVIRSRAHEAPSPIQSLATRNDTLFVLYRSTDDPSLSLYQSPSLARIGTWQILGIDESRDIVDLDVRNGVTLLSMRRVLKANVSVKIESTK